MFLIVSICILYYFGDVEPTHIEVKEHDLQYGDLETDYMNRIVKRGKNMDANYRICYEEVTDKTKTLVMTACKSTMDRLRKTVPKYYDNLYVYYHYYEIDTNPLCKTAQVKLSNSYEDYEDQLMVQCYGHPMFVKSKQPVSKIPNFRTILIYPTEHSYESWLVFEYDSDTETYALIEWYDISNVKENLVPVDLLLFPPPMVILDQSEIYTTLYPFFSTWNHIEATSHNHILYRVNSFGLEYLCVKITGEDTKETLMQSEDDIPKSVQLMLTLKLYSPKDDVNACTLLQTPAYSCDSYLEPQGWYLFMAPGNDAIILGKIIEASTSSSNVTGTFYKISVYIKNIYFTFIDYIF